MAGLLGGLFGGGGSAPERKIVELDQGTQGLINQVNDRSNRDASAFGADINQGVAGAADSLGESPQAAMQSDLRAGGPTPYMGEALRQAYSSRSQENVGRLIKSNEYKGMLAKGDQMRRAAQTQIAQQRVAANNNARLVDAYNQQEAARAQFISSIFQTVSTGLTIAAASRGAKAKPSATDSMSMPEIGSGVGNPNAGGGYGLGVAESGAGGYGEFPGSQASGGYGLGGNFNYGGG